MFLATVHTKQDQAIRVASREALDRLVVEVSEFVDAHGPFLVTFDCRGCTTYLGLTQSRGVVHIVPNPDAPPYMITVGDPTEDGVIAFMLHGEHHTEIEAKHLVPVADAWAAVRMFIETGNLLPSIVWEEV